MRIWIIHQHAIPPITMGPTRHYDLAKKLIKAGHEVYIFASNYCHNTFKYIAEPYSKTQKISYYDSVPFIWFNVPAFRKNSVKRVFNMLVFAYNLLTCKDLSLLPKPDVIIGSSPSPLAAYAAAKIARKLNVPFVYEIRDLWPETLLTIGGFNRYHPLVFAFGYIEKKLLQEAKKIISVLPGVKDYLITKNICQEKVVWIPNFSDIAVSQPPVAPSKNIITVLYAGSFNFCNDLETLLHAAKILEERCNDKFKILLVGDGPRKNALKDFVGRNNLKNVDFHFTLPKEHVHRILATADICVGMVKKSHLYRWGTSLNKITDYLASARPIIFALDSPYNPIADANAGLTIEPENPHKLVEAILQLAALPAAERQQLGLNGRNYALQNFNLDTLSCKLIEHLQAI